MKYKIWSEIKTDMKYKIWSEIQYLIKKTNTQINFLSKTSIIE